MINWSVLSDKEFQHQQKLAFFFFFESVEVLLALLAYSTAVCSTSSLVHLHFSVAPKTLSPHPQRYKSHLFFFSFFLHNLCHKISILAKELSEGNLRSSVFRYTDGTVQVHGAPEVNLLAQ